MLEGADRIEADKLYNSRIFSYYIKLFRDKYPHVDISDLLDYARIDQTAIDDPLEWFTQEQSDRFVQRLSRYFENPSDIAREAGRYLYSDKVLGLWRQFSLKLLGVGYLYKNIGRYASVITRTSSYSSRQLASNKYEIKVKFNVKEPPHQEYNRLGALEAAPLMYSDKMAKIESRTRGDTTTYIVTWDEVKSQRVEKYRVRFLLLAPLGVLGTLVAVDSESALYLALFSLMGYLALLATKYNLQLSELAHLSQIQQQTAETIIQSYIEDYEQVNVLNRIGRILLRSNSSEDFLPTISEILKRLSYRKVSFFLSDFDNAHITRKFNDGYGGSLGEAGITIDILEKTKPLLNIPKVIAQISDLDQKLPLGLSRGFAAADFPIVFVPIVTDAAFLGFFFVTPDECLLPIVKKKLDFLVGVASHVALGLHKQQAFYNIAESDRMKSNFISTASHELKTPIQVMMMGLEEIEHSGNVADNLPPLKAVAAKMKEHVENFLSLQRIENKAYSLDFQPFTPDELLKSLKAEMRSTAKAFTHHARFEGFSADAPEISGDLKRLSMVLMNLFSNSCKFTPRPGMIVVAYVWDATEHRICVADNGIGIARNDIDKIFIKFYQASGTGSVGGFGLGLSIAKEIVTLHNGYITVSSPLTAGAHQLELDHLRVGTAITIHLPRK